VHVHDTDPSVAMPRVVRFILFVLCFKLVPVSVQLASIWPLTENCSQLKAIHSMRRGAGRGKPDDPKRLPIALGFKCVHCQEEFDSRNAIEVHHRQIMSVGTPCADHRNHKSMSMIDRVDQAAGIFRQHDARGKLPIPVVCFSQNMLR
jgi:hypothetical protein